MVSLMTIREMAHYHHLVITITGVPPWTPTKMRPIKCPPHCSPPTLPTSPGGDAVPCLHLQSELPERTLYNLETVMVMTSPSWKVFKRVTDS